MLSIFRIYFYIFIVLIKKLVAEVCDSKVLFAVRRNGGEIMRKEPETRRLNMSRL